MKQLTCEMCGSTELIKQDGFFVCQTCGTKYSVEEAKKMMIEGTVEVAGTVRVDDTSKIDNYYTMADNAYDADNKQEAENIERASWITTARLTENSEDAEDVFIAVEEAREELISKGFLYLAFVYGEKSQDHSQESHKF